VREILRQGRSVAAVMLLCVVAAAAQKTRYSESHKPDPLDYPLTVHVTHARLEGTPLAFLHVDAQIDGKRVELQTGATGLLHTGDYRGRIVTESGGKSGWFSRSYELLFSDGTRVVFTEVAESE
jgi:hypothetical protein